LRSMSEAAVEIREALKKLSSEEILQLARSIADAYVRMKSRR